MALAVSLVTASKVDAELIDNFDDGNDIGWSHIDNTVNTSWGPATFDAGPRGTFSYTLATSGDVPAIPPGISDSIFSEWINSSDLHYSNGFLRAKMRPDTEATNFFLILRRTGGSGYALGGSTNSNVFFISRVDDAATIPLVDVSPQNASITAGQDWIVEAGAVGNQLSLKFWRDGDSEPSIPQLKVTDSTYSSGTFLVGAVKDRSFLGTGRVSATFDDIFFRVPEPSSLLLLVTTCTCCLMQSRRRRTR